jgi:hypothetical protein
MGKNSHIEKRLNHISGSYSALKISIREDHSEKHFANKLTQAVIILPVIAPDFPKRACAGSILHVSICDADRETSYSANTD